jgi:leucyl aminopeptidase (aminopeptidase T)
MSHQLAKRDRPRVIERHFNAETVQRPLDRHVQIERVHLDIRIAKTRWVVFRMAQQANRSTEAFEDFYFNVCTLDYARMGRAMRPLVERMARFDRAARHGTVRRGLAGSMITR